MKEINSYLLAASMLLALVALLFALRQKIFMDEFSKELNNSINEARQVREDLLGLMDDAVSFSDTLAKDMENLAQLSDCRVSLLQEECEPQPEVDALHGQEFKFEKKRVYQLAKEMGISTKQLLADLRSSGIIVTNHMNALSGEQLARLREWWGQQKSGTPKTIGVSVLEDKRKQSSVVIEEPSAPSAINFDDLLREQLLLTTDIFSVSSVASGEVRPLLLEKEQYKQSDLGLGFSLEDLRNAHPYLAVRMLVEKGYTVREAAQVLQRGQGEVSLILNLLDKKKVSL